MGVEIIIIGDIIKSRKKFDPVKWENFHRDIDCLNKEFDRSLKIPLAVYSGDSFGSVVKDLKSAVKIVLKIPETLEEYQSRVLIIEDEISYGMRKKNFLYLEGPALWKSSQMLKELKNKSNLFGIDIENKTLNMILHSLMNLILAIKQDWSNLQNKIYADYLKMLTQEEIAKKYAVTQQYVSKIIRTSHFKLIRESTDNLTKIIDEHD